MLFEMRTYTCKAGKMPEQHEIYVTYGQAAQVKHLGQPVMFAKAETGLLETYVHIWVYEDQADRQRKRESMLADPDFQEYRNRFLASGNMVQMESRLFNSVPFFPDAGRNEMLRKPVGAD